MNAFFVGKRHAVNIIHDVIKLNKSDVEKINRIRK